MSNIGQIGFVPTECVDCEDKYICDSCKTNGPQMDIAINASARKTIDALLADSSNCIECIEFAYETHKCRSCTMNIIRAFKNMGYTAKNFSVQTKNLIAEVSDELLFGYDPYLHVDEDHKLILEDGTVENITAEQLNKTLDFLKQRRLRTENNSQNSAMNSDESHSDEIEVQVDLDDTNSVEYAQHKNDRKKQLELNKKMKPLERRRNKHIK